jgi:hypothetical protein
VAGQASGAGCWLAGWCERLTALTPGPAAR